VLTQQQRTFYQDLNQRVQRLSGSGHAAQTNTSNATTTTAAHSGMGDSEA